MADHPQRQHSSTSRGKHLPRVGGGKQVPSFQHLPQRGHASTSSSSRNGQITTSWTVRDAAYAILQDRQKLLGNNNNNHSDQPMDRTSTAPTQTNSMFLSQHFEVDELLQQLRDEKKATIQQAFHSAATAAWNAISLQQQQQQQQQQSPIDHGTTEERAGATSVIPDLPPQCCGSPEHPQAPLDALRKFSLERSFENREYTKRKGGKKDEDYVPPRQYKRPKVGTASQPVPSVSATTPTPTKATSSSTKKAIPDSNKSSSSAARAKPTLDSMPSSKSLTATAVPAETITAEPVVSSTPKSAIQTAASSATNHHNPNTTIPSAPKCTRNTPASSATALDVRFQSSRAIVCVAGCQAFTQLTPGFDSQPELDCLDVPQAKASSPIRQQEQQPESSTSTVNMGAVRIEAQALSERAVCVTTNAVRRSEQRRHSRRASARYHLGAGDTHCLAKLPNPFAYQATTTVVSDPDDDEEEEDSPFPILPPPFASSSSSCKPRSALTSAWQSTCLPRLRQVLQTGAGHAIYHDVQWATRHGRLAHLWHTMPLHQRYGPHLIVCTTPDVERWAREFAVGPSGVLVVPRVNDDNDEREPQPLQALVYRGNARQRQHMRTQFFPLATGWLESPFHVCITSYQMFLRDYLHFCQLPWESVLLDDGVAWMATKEQTATLGTIFEQAIFAANDHHMGLAGTSSSEWDYSRDDWSTASAPTAVAATTTTTDLLKDAWIGLTARHRIVTVSTFAIPSSSSSSSLSISSKATSTTLDTAQPQQHRNHLVSVSALLEFVAPQFAQVAKEEWDRSKIAGDKECMRHFRKLVARSVVVHMDSGRVKDGDLATPSSVAPDLYTLAMRALTGTLPAVERASDDPSVPEVIDDDRFVSAGLVANSRRSSLQWLGPSQSWLRYELGSANFAPILEAIKISNNSGFVCEEITTASCTTSSGATGQVCGSMAYRLAVVCGRHFGSEPGLRQHIAAHHAPAGTWLCRTCSSDCVTSQARTHHERTCGQPFNGIAGESGGTAGAVPTVGQGGKTKIGVGKKKAVRGPAKAGSVVVKEERDPDGSIRVPGYRGVWVNPQGKHFVKVDGKSLKKKSDKDKILFFSAVEQAAKKYDEVIQKGQSENANLELNYNANGTRIVYDDIAPASTSSLGGSATTVVPSLSVINIKDLPADVKPLLRDPRQTSRTGGNSKRHVYAYRGVCRQSRKGHDRWQSQISFMGTNHYLGTFDSEWDAAAIYAWAHLILYGEEATRQAQKEGEEAAAAYEQEQRDIAAGKIPEPPPKPEKKKKTKEKADTVATAAFKAPGKTNKKRKASALTTSSSSPAEKNARTAPARAGTKSEKEAMAPTLAKGVAKTPILAPRDITMKDDTLIELASERLKAARNYMNKNSAVDELLRPCLPGQMFQTTSHSKSYINAAGGAILLGLSPCMFGWDLQEFVESCQLSSEQDTLLALQLLAVEYDDDGTNEKFRSLMQGSVCTIGSASQTTQLMYHKLGLGTVPLGGYVGKLDCHIGGTPGSCSERAALIRYIPTEVSEFQFTCLSDDDIVTINGRRLITSTRSYPIFHGDICSVGARVFVFVLPARD